jgi:hypothetical protein
MPHGKCHVPIIFAQRLIFATPSFFKGLILFPASLQFFPPEIQGGQQALKFLKPHLGLAHTPVYHLTENRIGQIPG